MELWNWLKSKIGKGAASTVLDPQTRDVPAESSYSTDQPIRSAADDRFARASFARRIAETVAARHEPSSLVLGLYGPWGDGKTSVLYMIQERLEADSGVIVVRFNPWHFTSEEQLIRGFFGTLGATLGKSLESAGERIGEFIRKYGSYLSLASASVAGGAITLNPGQAAQGIGEALSTTTLDELKDRIGQALSSAGKKIVVLIDDIDRLDRDETHAMFKLVKLSAGFDYTTYILAFDEDVVAAALGARYGDGGYAAGRAFLEKIIQVPIHLPPADSTALRQLAFEGIDKALSHAAIDLERGDVDLFTIQFTSGLESSLKTPRQARLYANALMFSLPLVKGEVNIVDFMLVEGLRVFYPKLHSAIRDKPSPWLDQQLRSQESRSERVRQILDESIPSATDAEREALARGMLQYLFPRTADMQYGSDWETQWGRDKRVCSQAYFRRYFAYGIPINDVSDRAIDDLIVSAPSLETAPREEALLQLMRAAPAAFVRKMRHREEQITEEQARSLAVVLARNGSSVPVERGLFAMGGTRMQAAILIARLLRKIPEGEARNEVAAAIVEAAVPLPFAVECQRWMMPGRDEPEGRRLLTAEVLDSLAVALATRAIRADEQTPLYRQFGFEARALYWLWKDVDADGASARLRENLGRSVAEVDAFLDIYVGEAWGMTDGLPRRSDFRRDAYDDIVRLIDPAYIAQLLRDRYGSELDQPEYHQGDEVPIYRRIAHQFVFVHRAAMSEVAQT